jgi:hypothetical protein
MVVLYVVTGLGSAAFGFKIISGWFKERRQKQERQQQQADSGVQQELASSANLERQHLLMQQLQEQGEREG